ncbi:unnamed protein product [Rhizophagus irregularis]|nr:unnamed protein product [Rhizophagus irregularis]
MPYRKNTINEGPIGQCVFCSKAGFRFTCKSCQMNYLKKNFKNWTSGNKKINNFIQQKQLKKSQREIIFEWIPYDGFSDIKGIGKDDIVTVYSAIWKDGQLRYDKYDLFTRGFIRVPNEKVALKCLDNPQNGIDKILNKIDEFSINNRDLKIYGLSQNPNTKEYIIVLQNGYCKECGEKYTNIMYTWCKPCHIKIFTSGNEEIDDYIREIQSQIHDSSDIVVEWIPYNQFNKIEEIGKSDSAKIYSAVWKDGPLHYDNETWNWTRNFGEEVALKCLNDSRDDINRFLSEAKKYSVKINDCHENKIYGISQNPDTKNYIMVLNKYFDKHCVKCDKIYTETEYKWCKPCQINYLKGNFINWTSENNEIDNFIQEMQLKISYKNITLEWIPYNQFYDIEEICKGWFATVYSAIWKDGPLCYNLKENKYIRESDKAVTLKCFNCSQNVINEFLNEAKNYSIKKDILSKDKIYGISRKPNTEDYILILYNEYSQEYFKECYVKYGEIVGYRKIFTNWISGNEKIDNLIQEMQSKININGDILFEWIPYNQFIDIEKIGQGGFATVYSATWKNGPLRYYKDKNEWIRSSDKKVALKCLNNSQNINNEFLNEVKAYSVNNFDSQIIGVYGISQNPLTKDYIMVLQYAEGRNFNYWMNNNSKYFSWLIKLKVLSNIINGLKEIHQKQMVHRDFHIGNILFKEIHLFTSNYISDMGLCGEIGNIDETNIYGVMPYVAPEVLRGNPYTQAADIYSFGMIMYFTAIERQPFSDFAHDHLLVLDMCKGIRPEINEPEAPKCYIDLMKKCWDSNPVNRPNAAEIEETIISLYNSYRSQDDNETKKQFQGSEKYRSINKNRKLTIHPQAIYTSRLLNPFTKDLPNDNTEFVGYIDSNTAECLDCKI